MANPVQINIGPLYAVAYLNEFSNRIVVYAKLFDNQEEAEKFANDNGGTVSPVFYKNHS